jgi:hypothetical protein
MISDLGKRDVRLVPEYVSLPATAGPQNSVLMLPEPYLSPPKPDIIEGGHIQAAEKAQMSLDLLKSRP